MISHPALTRPCSLPDYYGDERRALRRVRLRRSAGWLGLAVAGMTLLLWQVGRESTVVPQRIRLQIELVVRRAVLEVGFDEFFDRERVGRLGQEVVEPGLLGQGASG